MRYAKQEDPAKTPAAFSDDWPGYCRRRRGALHCHRLAVAPELERSGFCSERSNQLL